MNTGGLIDDDILEPTTAMIVDKPTGVDIKHVDTYVACHKDSEFNKKDQVIKSQDMSIMVTNLKEGLIDEVNNTRPYQRHLKGKGWLRIKFTMVLIGGIGSVFLVSSLVRTSLQAL